MFKYAAPDSYAAFTNKKSITFLINVFPKQILIEDKMNREMLKEAIAEAKTIKETAIASAKAALEEAFTPQLTAMFAEKLNEMDEKMEEEMTKGMDENYGEDELNLEEILAELGEGEDENMEEGIFEADEDDMEDMDIADDKLEAMVKDILSQMLTDKIEAGEIEAGENFEKEEGEIDTDDVDAELDMKDEEEISIDELLAEIDSLSEKEELDEVGYVDPGSAEMISQIGQFFGGLNADQVLAMVAALPAAIVGGAFAKTPIANAIKKLKAKIGSEKVAETADTKEMEETINELRKELNEVNLLNAKLLYTNKIFKAKNLTESEKVKVLNTFDKAETVKEVKLVFETLTESFKATAKKNPIKESLGGASKTIATAAPKQEQIIEVNDAFARMQRLAGLRK